MWVYIYIYIHQASAAYKLCQDTSWRPAVCILFIVNFHSQSLRYTIWLVACVPTAYECSVACVPRVWVWVFGCVPRASVWPSSSFSILPWCWLTFDWSLMHIHRASNGPVCITFMIIDASVYVFFASPCLLAFLSSPCSYCKLFSSLGGSGSLGTRVYLACIMYITLHSKTAMETLNNESQSWGSGEGEL